MTASDTPIDPADLRAMWDFADPDASVARFSEALERLDPTSVWAGELTTQLARAHGLAGRFAEGHRLLDGLERDGAPRGPVVRARIALERGRLLNTSGTPSAAIPHFIGALEVAGEASRDDLAADALHMLAIVDTDREADWYARGVALATASSDPQVRQWRGPLHNNHGWALHDRQRYDDALEAFRTALDAYRETGDTESIRIAEWTIARCLRSLGRREEALAIQRRLKAAGGADRYVDEELAILEANPS